ncbi:MAG: polysaccharide biosynthesis C-terminal domain-containing protein [Bdellovibrionales bacterium]|nr:polysaccharide biosynthesis C-terminal domain-containing protein [Bdellovibrionales bacterium]
MKSNINKLLSQIIKDSVLVAICTIAAKALTAGKDIYLAASFGISNDVDIYFLALAVPIFLSSVLISVFQSLLIPEFVLFANDKKKNGSIFYAWLICSFIISLFFSLILVSFNSWILSFLAPGFTEDKLQLTSQIFSILSHIVWIRSFSAISSSFLNAKKKFLTTTLSQTAMPIAMVVYIFLNLKNSNPAQLISIATVIGFAVEALILTGLVLKEIGGIFLPQQDFFTTRFKRLLPQGIALLIGSAAMGSTILIDQAMAASLSQGSITALSYGLRISEVLIFLTAAAISTSVFPYFSDLVESNDFSALKSLQQKIVIGVLFISLFPTLLFFFGSEFLVSLIYQRGLFTIENTKLVANVQSMYVLQVPFYTASLVYVRLISSLRRNEILMISTFISVIANILLNILLMREFGAAGIALSTSIVNIITLVFLGSCSSRILCMPSAK